jgi:thiamine kinase-like enzyme
MALAIAEVAQRCGFPAGRGTSYTLLKGGLSHLIVQVQSPGRNSVLRVLDPAVGDAGLGIPVGQEIENTVRAASSGVGPAVDQVLNDPPAIVLEYIDGRTLSAADVRDPAMIPRIAQACRRLHAGPAFGNDFSIFRKAEELFTRCERAGLAIPGGYADRRPIMDELERALAYRPLPPVPCHNDLLAENLIDDGQAVRIIDYQLSGMNDPAFELGDIAAEADYTPDQCAALAAAYFGAECTPALVARVRLYLLTSNITWTLWFAVHHGLLRAAEGAAGFDYTAEAQDKWAQAVRDMDSPDLPGLLDMVRG